MVRVIAAESFDGQQADVRTDRRHRIRSAGAWNRYQDTGRDRTNEVAMEWHRIELNEAAKEGQRGDGHGKGIELCGCKASSNGMVMP